MDFDRAKVPEGDEADTLVERALFLAATGYWYTEVKRESTEKTGEKITRTRKQAAPNLTAIALWLSHRMPETWGEGSGSLPENNLLTLLRGELGGGETNEVSGLQPEAEDGAYLVEQAGDPGSGRHPL